MFWRYRLAANLPTRHRDERPKTMMVHTHTGPGTEREEHWVPLEECPLISFAVPELGLAGILTGAPTTTVFQVNPKILHLTRDTETGRRWGAEGKHVEVSSTIPITPFTQLLAKIAHAFAVAELGYGTFTSFLPPLILGTADESLNLPDFVGGIGELPPNDEYFLGPIGSRVTQLVQHHLNCEIVKAASGTQYLTVLIKLLQFVAPPYRVVVARHNG
jgi:hypothetical protein